MPSVSSLNLAMGDVYDRARSAAIVCPEERKDIWSLDRSMAMISFNRFSSSSFDSIRISRIIEKSTSIFGYSAFPFISNVARNSFSFTLVTSGYSSSDVPIPPVWTLISLNSAPYS